MRVKVIDNFLLHLLKKKILDRPRKCSDDRSGASPLDDAIDDRLVPKAHRGNGGRGIEGRTLNNYFRCV